MAHYSTVQYSTVVHTIVTPEARGVGTKFAANAKLFRVVL